MIKQIREIEKTLEQSCVRMKVYCESVQGMESEHVIMQAALTSQLKHCVDSVRSSVSAVESAANRW